jgi:hypothetical protein
MTFLHVIEYSFRDVDELKHYSLLIFPTEFLKFYLEKPLHVGFIAFFWELENNVFKLMRFKVFNHFLDTVLRVLWINIIYPAGHARIPLIVLEYAEQFHGY